MKYLFVINNKFILVLLFFIIITIQACVPPSSDSEAVGSNNYNNPIIKAIIQFQDKGQTDSLFKYFNHKNSGIRLAAIKAFASNKDTNAIESLSRMLKDPILEVRAQAAQALGQIGSDRAETALIAAFSKRDSSNVNNIMNRNILEALGKVSSKSVLKNIASVITYRPSDNELLLGQIRSLYRFGLRGIFDEAATTAATKYALDDRYSPQVRLMAAHYLSRFKELDLTLYQDKIMSRIETEDDLNIKMALANSLSKVTNLPLARRLINEYTIEKDYRVKANILRALGNVEFDSIKSDVFKAVADPNPQIGLLAAELIGKRGKKEDLYVYKSLITDGLDWRVKSKMYHSLMKASPIFYTKIKNELAREIIAKFNASNNPYERAAYIKALGADPYQYLTLAGMRDKTISNVEKSSIIESLGDILNNPDFSRGYGAKYGEVKQYIINLLIESCKSGDPGMVASAASILKKPELVAKEFVYDSTWYDVSKSLLKLPRDLEALYELDEAKATFKNIKYIKPKVTYNHPIAFEVLTGYGDTIKAVMKTTKGNITMNLYPSQAIGSVANFISLINADFYDNKFFHRVVPNFVIQAGCPRGDGFGSADYTIRSELDQAYYTKAGLIGMASAGNHTESTQFFITHSPTPHLDGNYTIFGEVAEGMDVVHNILIGDKIIDIILLKK